MSTVERVSLADQTVHKLIRLIKDNRLTVGDKLPTEVELVKTLAVGRGTLREAVKALVSRNVLEVRQGAGIFVSAKRGVSEDPLGLEFVEEQDRVALDLLELRLMLEPELAALAAVRRGEDQVEELRAQCGKLEELILAGQDYGEQDVRFHQLLAQCSGNVVVGQLIPIISSSVYASIQQTGNHNFRETVRQHREILKAVEQRDALSARWAMTDHLYTNRQTILAAQGRRG